MSVIPHDPAIGCVPCRRVTRVHLGTDAARYPYHREGCAHAADVVAAEPEAIVGIRYDPNRGSNWTVTGSNGERDTGIPAWTGDLVTIRYPGDGTALVTIATPHVSPVVRV